MRARIFPPFELAFCPHATMAARVLPQRPRAPGRVSNTLLAPPCQPWLPAETESVTVLCPIQRRASSHTAKRLIFGPGKFHTRPEHVRGLLTHNLCVLGVMRRVYTHWRRGYVRSAVTGRPRLGRSSAFIWGFPYLSYRDKKLWISCHDLSKYGKPHTNADTAPLGGRPVSALPTPPPPPCDYTGYDPPKKHTNRRWKSLKGTWAACGTRSPQ